MFRELAEDFAIDLGARLVRLDFEGDRVRAGEAISGIPATAAATKNAWQYFSLI